MILVDTILYAVCVVIIISASSGDQYLCVNPGSVIYQLHIFGQVNSAVLQVLHLSDGGKNNIYIIKLLNRTH